MPKTILVILVAIAILVMYIRARRRAAAVSQRAVHPQVASRRQAGSISPELREQIVTLAADRGQPAAVEHVRQISGLGLAESGQLVDSVLTGPRRQQRPDTTIDLTGTRAEASPGNDSSGGSLASRAQAERDRAGQLAAIRLVQHQTGMGTEDARRFVNSLD